MPFLVRGGAEIFFETWDGGADHWITLINGFSRPLTDFRMLAKGLAETGTSVLSLDNRGAGKTKISEAFTLEDMAADVRALWDHLSIESSFVLGISFGGVITQRLTLNTPKRVKGMILVSTSPTSAYLPKVTLLQKDKDEALEQSLRQYVSDQFAEANQIFVRALIKQMASAFRDPTQRKMAEMQRNALSQFDFRLELSKVQCPALVVHGDADHVIPIQAGEDLVRCLPQAEWKPLPGVGHLILAEAPKILLELSQRFCQR